MEKINNIKMDNTAASNINISPQINAFAKKNNLDADEIQKNYSNLEDSLEELSNCQKCKGYNYCKNHIKGYVYYPQKRETKVTFDYIPCKYLKKYEEDIKSKDGSSMLASARMKDIDVNDGNRVKLIKWINDFYHKYDKSKINKGLYLHGSFGGGKTFLLAALLNELKENYNAEYEIVYFPELLRTLKDNFALLDAKVRWYSKVEILLIDDIGAEKVTDWGRDEILGTILQYRMNNHMTTFFTSNLTINELEKHLSLSKDSEDIVKARRIIERIKQLTIDMELITSNHRN